MNEEKKINDDFEKIDFEEATTFDQVDILWDGAYSRNYKLEVSNDGETWEILYRPSLGTKGGVGFPIAGTFRNGECLVCVQKQEGNQVVIDAPIIISEGVHKYTSNGISVEDRIFSKVVSSNNITRI